MTLVSAIMPTRGRCPWAASAVSAFLGQTYPFKQLIILDDAEEPSFREPPDLLPRVIYTRHEDRLSIPEKRNRCCAMASGELICHWDSDDWSAPARIAHQVRRVEDSGKPVVGYHSMFFYQTEPEMAYWYRGYPLHPIGTSLMYTREWWKAHPFTNGPEDPNVGEDTAFGKEARDADQIVTVEAGFLMVARIHSGNTSIKRIGPCTVEYRSVELNTLPRGFFA